MFQKPGEERSPHSEECGTAEAPARLAVPQARQPRVGVLIMQGVCLLKRQRQHCTGVLQAYPAHRTLSQTTHHLFLVPEAHSTLRFPRSRAAVRCLRTSVSWGLGPRGLAPCRRGFSFKCCSSFDSPRRSSAISSASETINGSKRWCVCWKESPRDLRTLVPQGSRLLARLSGILQPNAGSM